MTKFSQDRLSSIEFSRGFETKLVVKRRSASREFAQLRVPVKHLRICPVCSNCGQMRMFDSALRDRAHFVEDNNNSKGDDLNVNSFRN